jgi:hypothetical protein
MSSRAPAPPPALAAQDDELVEEMDVFLHHELDGRLCVPTRAQQRRVPH